jgi:hypothetical protein
MPIRNTHSLLVLLMAVLYLKADRLPNKARVFYGGLKMYLVFMLLEKGLADMTETSRTTMFAPVQAFVFFMKPAAGAGKRRGVKHLHFWPRLCFGGILGNETAAIAMAGRLVFQFFPGIYCKRVLQIITPLAGYRHLHYIMLFEDCVIFV